ncbi:MAG TPA: ATP-dependent helicase, partial [Actinomycetales bacterium]|nr:ATP-dependent helicase [Actinomycetales bacterium]
GRTGRAGMTGTAVTFVDWDDVPRWSVIDRTLDLGFPEPIETYSSSEHLFTDLDIPAGTKGVLPKDQRTRAGLGAERVEDLGETGKRTSRGGGAGGRGGRGGRNRNRGAKEQGKREQTQKNQSGQTGERRPRRRRRTRGGRPVDTKQTAEN